MGVDQYTSTHRFDDLGDGGVRISSKDPEAIRAIHAFMAFQRGDHRSGGKHQ